MNCLPNTVDPLGDSYFRFDLILTEFPAAKKTGFQPPSDDHMKKICLSKPCLQAATMISAEKTTGMKERTVITETTSAPMPIWKQLSVCHILYLMIRKCWENKKLYKIIKKKKNTHSLLWTLHQHDHSLKQKIRKEEEVGHSYKNKQVLCMTTLKMLMAKIKWMICDVKKP